MMKKWLIFACTIASVLADGLFSPENLSVDDSQGLRTASGLKKEKDPYDLNLQHEDKDSVAQAKKQLKPENEQKSNAKEMSTTESILSFFRPQSKKKNNQPKEDASTGDKAKKKLEEGKKKTSHKTKEAKKKAKTNKDAQKAKENLNEKKEHAKQKAGKAKDKTKQFIAGKKHDIKKKSQDEKLKQKEEKLKANEEQAKISSKAQSSASAATASSTSAANSTSTTNTKTSTSTSTKTSSPSPTSSLVDPESKSKEGGIKAGGGTKTVTITEIRIVTVYKEKSPKPTPDVGGLFGERMSSSKSVYVAPASSPKDEYEGEQISNMKEKEIKSLRDQKKKIQKQIHQLEEKIASLEVEIAVTTKDTELRKKIVKDKQNEYEKQKNEFLNNKNTSEKKINAEMKALESNREKSAKSKESKKEAEVKMQSLKKEHSEISKQAKSFKPEKAKAATEEEGVGKKTINKIKDSMSSISQATTPHPGASEKIKPAEKAGEKAVGKAGEKSKPKTPQDKSSVSVSSPNEHKKAEGAEKLDSQQQPATQTVGGVTCEMPSAISSKEASKDASKEAPKVEMQQKNPLTEGKKEECSSQPAQSTPFAQNFSNGHLVVSGSPISADPKVIAKTQQLFNKSLEKAAEKSKRGDKILAFWGYITSLLSPEK